MQIRAPKKHLPVLGHSPAEDEETAAAWLWSLLGSLVVIATWGPLAIIVRFGANALGSSQTSLWGSALVAVAHLLTFAFSCWLGGALVGRFATRARVRDSILAGVWGSGFILLLAALGNALRPPVVGVIVAIGLLLVAIPSAAQGGAWGVRRRTAARAPDGDHVHSSRS